MRVLILALLLGASTMAVAAPKGILGQAGEQAGSPLSQGPRTRAEEEEELIRSLEEFLARPELQETLKLVDDTIAGKDTEAEISAFHKKNGIDPNPWNRAKQLQEMAGPNWPQSTPALQNKEPPPGAHQTPAVTPPLPLRQFRF